MSSTYYPANDSQFSDWLDRFASYLIPHALEFGLTPADLEKLEAAHPDWDTALFAHLQAQATARNLCSVKNANRKVVEDAVRELVVRIKAYPETTEAQLEALGIATPSGGITVNTVTDERPHALIDISSRLRHVLRFQNETPTGTSKAKPAGAIGCEVWHKVGEAPESEGDVVYVGLATRSPYVVEYSQADAGKTAHYMMRWVKSGGIKGAWSDPEPATIAA